MSASEATERGDGGMPAPRPLESHARAELGQNLTYGMVECLGRAVVTGQYDNMPFPVEAELGRQYRVSRSVTREAVKMLTAKGLLSARPRQGTIVEPSGAWNLLDADVLRWLADRRFSLELLRQFSELRVTIEPEAAALAARFAHAEDCDRIDAALQAMRAAERGAGDTLEADIAFHVAVLRASRNPFYAQFRGMVLIGLRTSIRFTNQAKGRTADVAAHAAVRDAIERRDAGRARVAMRGMIVEVLELIRAAEGA